MVMPFEGGETISGREQARQQKHCYVYTRSEACWFLLCLLLFMILGPFGGPVAVLVVFTAPRDEEAMEPVIVQSNV